MNDLASTVDKILNPPAEKDIPHKELTGKIIGCGPGKDRVPFISCEVPDAALFKDGIGH